MWCKIKATYALNVNFFFFFAVVIVLIVLISEVFLYQIFLISIMITAILLSIWMKFIQQMEHVAGFGELGIAFMDTGTLWVGQRWDCRGGITALSSAGFMHVFVRACYFCPQGHKEKIFLHCLTGYGATI